MDLPAIEEGSREEEIVKLGMTQNDEEGNTSDTTVSKATKVMIPPELLEMPVHLMPKSSASISNVPTLQDISSEIEDEEKRRVRPLKRVITNVNREQIEYMKQQDVVRYQDLLAENTELEATAIDNQREYARDYITMLDKLEQVRAKRQRLEFENAPLRACYNNMKTAIGELVEENNIYRERVNEFDIDKLILPQPLTVERCLPPESVASSSGATANICKCMKEPFRLKGKGSDARKRYKRRKDRYEKLDDDIEKAKICAICYRELP